MALTTDRNTPKQDAKVIVPPVAAGANIKAGALIVANATGFAAPGSAALNLTYLGRANEAVDNSAGIDGAKTVRVERKQAFQFANSGTDAVTQASFGKLCYIEDDQTVSATDGTGTRSAAGTVVGIDSDGVWVE